LRKGEYLKDKLLEREKREVMRVLKAAYKLRVLRRLSLKQGMDTLNEIVWGQRVKWSFD